MTDSLENTMAQMITHRSLGWRLMFVVSILHCNHAITVDMSEQGLKSVPQNIQPNVTNLVLRKNRFVTLSNDSFYKYAELIKLNVENCGIQFIYSGTFTAQVKLETISIEKNNIRGLPFDFGPPINSLLTVKAGDAFAENYVLKPYYFSAFKHLNFLRVGVRSAILGRDHIRDGLITLQISSRSTTFPDISNLTNLKSFSIINKATFIPDEYIQGLDSLTSLYMDEGYYSVMPHLSHLKHLQTMSAKSNSLTEIPRNRIEGLTKVHWFDFQRNLLTVMPNMSYLTSASNIILSINRIRSVPRDTLCGLPNLRRLALNGNLISQIHNLQHLVVRFLHLDSNQLVALPELHGMRLWMFHINNNPVLCNQSLCWLRMWPWSRYYPRMKTPVCDQPPELKGVRLMDVHPVVLNCYNG